MSYSTSQTANIKLAEAKAEIAIDTFHSEDLLGAEHIYSLHYSMLQFLYSTKGEGAAEWTTSYE